MPYTIRELIRKKRDGLPLSSEEFAFFIDMLTKKKISDSQTGAMLMALYLNNLEISEISGLTKAMAYSGSVLKFKKFSKNTLVDKHSTGGVGDKVSLVLVPALAACGLKVPMMSGGGLGYTGGTLDKLESIPGFQIRLSHEQMNRCLEEAGCFICAASETLAPADAILYRTRDATSTVEAEGLIVSSILSKKVAEGVGTVVVDVKVGRGGTVGSREQAEALAKTLIQIGTSMELKVKAVTSDMSAPLGSRVGNGLEVEEAILCLRNKIRNEVSELVELLGGVLLEATGKAKTVREGEEMLRKSVEEGRALASFHKMLVLQGVSHTQAQTLCFGNLWHVLPRATYITRLKSLRKGFVTGIDALNIGKASWHLQREGQEEDGGIDHSTGLLFLKKRTDAVEADEPWLEIHHSKEIVQPEVEDLICSALSVEDSLFGSNFTPKNVSL